MRNSLLHYLDIHLGHIDLPAELRRELGLPKHFGIHAGRHLVASQLVRAPG